MLAWRAHYRYGVQGALGIYMLTFATACNYIFINFSVSHTHLPVSAASDYLHWVVYSAVHTTNIKNTALCNWWMSYLNFQIEHHMFPSMPQFRHPVSSFGLPWQVLCRSQMSRVVWRASARMCVCMRDVKGSTRALCGPSELWSSYSLIFDDDV
jgi:fatty acid desaturase